MMAALLPPQVKLSRGRHRRHRRGRAQCRVASGTKSQNKKGASLSRRRIDMRTDSPNASLVRWVGLSRQSGGMIEGRKGGGEVGGRTGNHFPRARGHDH